VSSFKAGGFEGTQPVDVMGGAGAYGVRVCVDPYVNAHHLLWRVEGKRWVATAPVSHSLSAMRHITCSWQVEGWRWVATAPVSRSLSAMRHITCSWRGEGWVATAPVS